MNTPIGVLPDITPTTAANLDIIALDIARTEYPVTILAHRLEAADYITNDQATGRAHLAEAARLSVSLNAVQDELSFRRIRQNVMNAIDHIKEADHA